MENSKKIMGNETSSVKIHSLLTAEDLKALRASFPGGGASATPLTDLNWGAWKEAWPENRREALEKLLKHASEDQANVSFLKMFLRQQQSFLQRRRICENHRRK